MTCTTHIATEFSITETKPLGFVGLLLSALRRSPDRLDLEGLSAHRLRDLGLADGHGVAPRDWMRD